LNSPRYGERWAQHWLDVMRYADTHGFEVNTDRTKAMVKAKVDWFKAHHDILESDLIHGRRADARDLDWMLHVNPKLKEKDMLVVFNPLNEPVTKKLRLNMYYAGVTDSVRIREKGGPAKRFKLARD